MIYITGDTHGGFQRFGSKYFPQQTQMGRNDYMIICGDFGGLWDGGQKDQHWLDWLAEKPFTTLFVDGNHENFDLLNALPEKEWHGGRVHEVRENILHLMRGQIFTFSGLTWFTMGGASSHDIQDGIPKSLTLNSGIGCRAECGPCSESRAGAGGRKKCQMPVNM